MYFHTSLLLLATAAALALPALTLAKVNPLYDKDALIKSVFVDVLPLDAPCLQVYSKGHKWCGLGLNCALRQNPDKSLSKEGTCKVYKSFRLVENDPCVPDSRRAPYCDDRLYCKPKDRNNFAAGGTCLKRALRDDPCEIYPDANGPGFAESSCFATRGYEGHCHLRDPAKPALGGVCRGNGGPDDGEECEQSSFEPGDPIEYRCDEGYACGFRDWLKQEKGGVCTATFKVMQEGQYCRPQGMQPTVCAEGFECVAKVPEDGEKGGRCQKSEGWRW